MNKLKYLVISVLICVLIVFPGFQAAIAKPVLLDSAQLPILRGICNTVSKEITALHCTKTPEGLAATQPLFDAPVSVKNGKVSKITLPGGKVGQVAIFKGIHPDTKKNFSFSGKISPAPKGGSYGNPPNAIYVEFPVSICFPQQQIIKGMSGGGLYSSKNKLIAIFSAFYTRGERSPFGPIIKDCGSFFVFK